MVWFQCDDCGENLKKPKINGHFGRCSASKFSCIDCGVTFNRNTVQGHTSCITEMEKYGPKGMPGKGVPEKKGKPGGATSGSDGVDIQLGLAQRPPWRCSLCNVNATSQDTLQAHAEGKKHRAKARAASVAASPAAPGGAAPGEEAGTAAAVSQNGHGAATQNGSAAPATPEAVGSVGDRDVQGGAALEGKARKKKGGKEEEEDNEGEKKKQKKEKAREAKAEKKRKKGIEVNGAAAEGKEGKGENGVENGSMKTKKVGKNDGAKEGNGGKWEEIATGVVDSNGKAKEHKKRKVKKLQQVEDILVLKAEEETAKGKAKKAKVEAALAASESK